MAMEERASRAALAVLDAWADPADPAEALAYRPLAAVLTGTPLPLPIEPDEVERVVAVARRNREYSGAHTDAMLPLDPPLLPGLLAHAEALDAKERAAFADRIAERRRRRETGPDAPGPAEAADVGLAHALRAAALTLDPEQAAVLCLRYGLSGDRPRRADEVARLLGTDPATVRGLEADALTALRDAAAEPNALRDVLDAAVAASTRAYP
ncbi:MAG TPA: sigma factor-like helix-turn-helix DNA-binding protein [Candidatus Limnocylindrales bacterium]|nr:sigma factor-like helix-turn-helix DNA-binding protein [Candidatus Limnocylindrales bacterium]